ncbi:hypothetical protein HK101_007192 [Irineochytrium annulatum]|nr:hypothetical protein HK101_007192 [Irineochytrium annulatum]
MNGLIRLKDVAADALDGPDEVFEALVKDATTWVNYRDEIFTAVKACRVFLPLINKKWADSGECESEYLLALRTNLISHDSGKTQRTIELPYGDSVAGIRRPAMLPIKFPSLSWGSNPKRTMLVKIVNGLRGLGIRVKAIEGDPPFTKMPKKYDSKTKISPLALAQQVITGIQFQLQNTQDLFALISQGSTSSNTLTFLDGCEVFWSMEFLIDFVDKTHVSSKMELEGTMIARPEHCIDIADESDEKLLKTAASAASFAKFNKHIVKYESAKAHLKGYFFPSRGLAQLDAYKKEDPSGLIRLCKYRIMLDRGADKCLAGKRAMGLFQPKADVNSDGVVGVVNDGGDFECIYGLADRTTIDFMIATASNAKSSKKLLASLVSLVDLPDTDQARQFVSELHARAPRSVSRAKEQEKKRKAEDEEKAGMLKKNAEFKLLLEEDEGIEESRKKDKGKSKEKREKKMRKRDEDGNGAWDGDEEGNRAVKRKRSARENPEDEEERLLRDKRERDEFVERLKKKDEDRTKQLVEDKSSKGNEEAAKRKKIADDAAMRQAALPSMREVSRQEYLKKREAQRLELLQKELQDEEMLFGRDKLTKKELEEKMYKEQTLKLALERQAISDKPVGYVMPEDYITEKGKLDKKKQEAVLYRRYQDNEDPDQFVSEQSKWEDHQAPQKYQQQQQQGGDEFDYVFDEDQHIKFIEAQVTKPDVESDTEEQKMSVAEKKAMTMKEIRSQLPIYDFRDDLLAAVEEFQVLIIVGETGSGKTTQIPQYLHEAGYTKNGRKVGCTQPRRVAAMSVAARVADEMGTKLGAEVGYSIRFEDCTGEKTIIKFMTDGMLLREFLTEPDLSAYSCLMIDEAHERTLHTDILFGLVKDIARYRKDLKLLISSATMDAEKFSKYFDDAPIFNIKGRKFPVSVYHTEAPEADYLKAAIQTIMTIHITEPRGDILLFLTGQEEIEAADQSLQLITKQLGSKIQEMKICPIYAALPSEKQAEIFEPTPEGVRKVVIATNIAETSITIDGIVYVIDPGFCKQKTFNPKTGMESLVVVPASRAAANQRKGRAGRVQPGKCFRLYTAWAYQNELEENTIPEIQRTNLASVVLMLKALGIDDLINFDFMDGPPAETLMKAMEQLYALGALNSKGELTKLGRRMAEFPIDPMLSKTLIASETYTCSEEVVSIIAMLTAGNMIFYKPKSEAIQAEQARRNFFRPGGDHLSLLAVWNQWLETNYSQAWCRENYIQHRTMNRARDVRDQLVGLMERTEVQLIANPDPGNTIPIRKAITSGFFYNTGRLQKSGDSYRTVKHNESVMIHPSSSLYISQSSTNTNKQYPKWVCYFELVYTTREFMRQVIEIQADWLLEGM